MKRLREKSKPMITVTIRIFATFREKIGKKSIQYTFTDNTTVKEVIDVFCKDYNICKDIFHNEMNLKEYISILINGRNISLLKGLITSLKDKDELSIFPPLAGGLD